MKEEFETEEEMNSWLCDQEDILLEYYSLQRGVVEAQDELDEFIEDNREYLEGCI